MRHNAHVTATGLGGTRLRRVAVASRKTPDQLASLLAASRGPTRASVSPPWSRGSLLLHGESITDLVVEKIVLDDGGEEARS